MSTTLTRPLSRDNRTAEFPGQLQQLAFHTVRMEQLATGILASVQRQDLSAEQRRTEFCAQLVARLNSAGLDPRHVNEISALAAQSNLFDN
jgi:hypothetical protein